MNPQASYPANAMESIAWAKHAGPLADWAQPRLVNRRDARGGYRDPADWDKDYVKKDGTKGKLGRTTTHKEQLRRAHLVRHFRAVGRQDVVGLHSTSPANTSRWGAIDIDWHGPTSTGPEINWRFAKAKHDQLRRDGLNPLLLDSNGKGGYHLWVLLGEPTPTPLVFHFLQGLVRDHAAYGMTARPETFPKQAELKKPAEGKTAYGNWLRAPGKHHTRDHWARVWNGSEWLVGLEAIAFILALEGDDPSLLPPIPAQPKTVPVPRQRIQYAGGDNLAARAAAYMARLPHRGDGEGRNTLAYNFAAFLARDLSLARCVALDWLNLWDSGNRPPLGSAELEKILENATQYGKHAVGCGLAPARPQHHRTTIRVMMEVS
jgi:hypothetical protein